MKNQSLDIIRSRIGDRRVKMAMILGSGLGPIADAVEGVSISYADLPGFPVSKVSGHAARLVIGTLEGVEVAVMSGREHFYENGNASAMRLPLEVVQALGAETFLATNACGSLRPGFTPGDLMLLNDHINFSGRSPLIGEETDARFVNLTNAYDPGLRGMLKLAASAEGIALNEGIYAWYSGPNFETPAEIRALQILGADAVGMSTVPEIILARFLGMRAGAVSVVTNMAAGLSTENISHEHTKESAPIGAAKLEQVLRRYLHTLATGAETTAP